MLRRLLADSVIYTAAGVIPGGLALVLLPVYTRFLQPKDYGMVDLISLVFTVVTVVATLEIQQGLARNLPEAAGESERRRLSSTAFWFTAVMMSIAVGLMLLATPMIAPWWVPDEDSSQLWKLGGAAAFLGAVSAMASRQLRWALRPRAYVATTTLTTLTTAGVTLLLLSRYDYGAAALIVGQTAGSGAGLFLAWCLGHRELGWTFDWSAARRMLSFSVPLVASTLGVLASAQGSRWIVAHGGSLEQAGYFGVASRVAGILALGASGVQLALGPILYTSYRDPQAGADLARSFRYFLAGGLVLWSGLTLFAEEVLSILVAPAFREAAPLIGPVTASVLLTQITIFAPGLDITHRTGYSAAVRLAAGGLNLLLGWIWVSRWGAIGAAVAMCVSATAQAAFIFNLSQRHYYVPHTWDRLGSAVAIVVLVTMSGGALSSYVPRLDGLLRATLIAVLAIGCWYLLVRQPQFDDHRKGHP